MRLTLKALNDELAKYGHTARLVWASGYFYFESGEAADWLDRTVNVPTVNSLTLPEWMTEFERQRRLTPRSWAVKVASQQQNGTRRKAAGEDD